MITSRKRSGPQTDIKQPEFLGEFHHWVEQAR